MKTLNSGHFSRKIIYISNLANYLLMLLCLFDADMLSDSFSSPFEVFKAIVISCAIIFCNWIICVIICHTLSNLWSKLEDTDADCWHSTPLLSKHQLSLTISAKTFCLSNTKSLHKVHLKTTQYKFTGKLFMV